MFDVITVGAATRDVFLVSKQFMLVPLPELGGGLAECVSLGHKIDVDKLVLTTGGGATNAAATFAALGFATACITRVGDDEPGHAILEDLDARKIDISLVKTVKGGQTGYSTLLTAVNGERTVLVYRGVSGEFKESDVKLSKIKAKWLYISSLAGNIPALLSLVRHAKTTGGSAAFNPGSAEVKLGLRTLDPILRQVDVLLLNLEEAQQLANLQTTDAKELAGRLLRPDMLLIISDGPNGAHAFKGTAYWRVGTRSIRSVSRTGAGDAFGSALVASLLHGLDVPDALRIATYNAESVIGQCGAKAGIIDRWPLKKAVAAISVTNS